MMHTIDIRPAKAGIYLDHNASTPLALKVRHVMHDVLEADYGNPSSGHWASIKAKDALEDARDRVAAFLGCASDEIYFTSGGTEANNMALKGIWFHPDRKGDHIITSPVEHDAIRAPIQFLKRQGAKVTVLPVDNFGRVDPEAVERAIRPETVLITVMHANNETGTVQPISEIARIAHANGVTFHTDAAQSAGKIETKVGVLGVDMLSLVGHKMYGPKGVGALYVRRGTKLAPHNHGGGHESGQRAGTESALLTSGLAAACDVANHHHYQTVGTLRDQFWALLKQAFGDIVHRNGSVEHCVPNTLNVSFENQVGADILAALGNVAAATGSACHAGCVDMSAVLVAMRTPMHVGMGAIRFSLGHQNTLEEMSDVVERLKAIL
ncbi:MAG: cysteine desulfurase family protein [Paracoccaceae bacterium]